MTLTQKILKNPIYKRIFLFFMTLGHFWPLAAEKAKKLVFESSKSGQNQFFGFFSLWRPKMTLTQKTQKNPIYERRFVCL